MWLDGIGFSSELQDPAWRRWFDILKQRGVTGLAGAESAPGSNQIRGFSVQPGEAWLRKSDVDSPDMARPASNAVSALRQFRNRQLEDMRRAQVAGRDALERQRRQRKGY
jgi:hypothetical protein